MIFRIPLFGDILVKKLEEPELGYRHFSTEFFTEVFHHQFIHRGAENMHTREEVVDNLGSLSQSHVSNSLFCPLRTPKLKAHIIFRPAKPGLAIWG